MKIIRCQNTINGQRCNKPRHVKKMTHNTKYCRACAAERQRQMSLNYYRENRKASKRSVNCKCPTCFDVRLRKIHLADPGEYENGKLFWKRCDPCKKAVDNIDCPDAGAYNVGGKHERI